MTEQQRSMRAHFRRPLLNLEAFALVVLGFVLHPALMFLAHPFLRHQGQAGKIGYDSGPQRPAPVCNDTWLFLRRAGLSREIVQALEVQRLSPCGDVRLPLRQREGYAGYVSQDPGFVLPEQPPAHRWNASERSPGLPELYMRHELFVTTPQQMTMGTTAEPPIGRMLLEMPTE